MQYGLLILKRRLSVMALQNNSAMVPKYEDSPKNKKVKPLLIEASRTGLENKNGNNPINAINKLS